ncbi:MAG: hypothetical protein KDC44_24145, partial [Phaeodactylibacter sp.]|nr:hypothetical protein [Phaeodactylibacter sp.]
LKRFVDECHSRGIAVILDVVYNHAFGQSPLVQLYFDGSPTPESPWFNQAATHPFNVGFDFNHESPATKYFVKRVMRYWIEEFKVDGFRFDLSKGFTQVNNPNDVGAWGNYDASRIAILKDYADECWTVDPDFYVILEHFANNIEEQELSDYGMMLWGNMHGAYTNTARGFADNLLAVSYKVRGFDQPGLVHYMESHDEERLMYSALQSGNTSNQFHNVRDLMVALRRIELNNAFFYTVPGPKMLWQFGEMGYDVTIDFNGRTGEKPIRWQYLDEPDRARLQQVTTNLIHLRHSYEVFHTEDFDVNIGATSPYNKVKNIQLNSPDMNVYVMGNFDVFDIENEPEFQHTGVWYEYFSGDSLEVTEANTAILLTPSEYRLYTDVKLEEPVGGYIQTTGVEEQQLLDLLVQVHPNPVSNGTTVNTWLPATDQVRIDLLSLDGRQLRTLFDGPSNGSVLALDLPRLATEGTYLLRFD